MYVASIRSPSNCTLLNKDAKVKLLHLVGGNDLMQLEEHETFAVHIEDGDDTAVTQDLDDHLHLPDLADLGPVHGEVSQHGALLSFLLSLHLIWISSCVSDSSQSVNTTLQ